MSALIAISKRRFGKIRALHVKKERIAAGLTILEGERLVAEALNNGWKIETAVGTDEFWSKRMDLVHRFSAAGVVTVKASPTQMEMLAVTEHSAGILAVVERPVWAGDSFWPKAGASNFLGLMTMDVQDPGNLGTIIRTLAAAGGSGVLLSAGSTEVGSPKMLRTSAGAVYKIPVLENIEPLPALQRLHGLGVQTLAAVAGKGRPHSALDLTKPTLLVLGNEGGGLSDEIIQACTGGIHIPMPGNMESLNVSAACAVMVFESVRQRRLAKVSARRNDA